MKHRELMLVSCVKAFWSSNESSVMRSSVASRRHLRISGSEEAVYRVKLLGGLAAGLPIRMLPLLVAVKGFGKPKLAGSMARSRIRPVSRRLVSLAPEVMSQTMMLESAEPEIRISFGVEPAPLGEIRTVSTLFTKSEWPWYCRLTCLGETSHDQMVLSQQPLKMVLPDGESAILVKGAVGPR